MTSCIHLGQPTGDTVPCGSCRKNVSLKVFRCEVYGQCTPAREAAGLKCCAGNRSAGGVIIPCPSYKSREPSETAMQAEPVGVATTGLDGQGGVSPQTRSSSEAAPSVLSNPVTAAQASHIQAVESIQGVTSSFQKRSAVIPQVSSMVLHTPSKHQWAYGVTTCSQRLHTCLYGTLESLKRSGFDTPWLFVDGDKFDTKFQHNATFRYPKVGVVANWMLGMMELLARNPECDRFVMFQDDVVVPLNLKAYLDKYNWPERGYLNLYTIQLNENRQRERGWWLSKMLEGGQSGYGAQGLCFTREGLLALFSQGRLIEKLVAASKRDKNLDGAVVTAMNRAGLKEYVHFPSLLQHTGKESSMGKVIPPWYATAPSFPGENFDCLTLLK